MTDFQPRAPSVEERRLAFQMRFEVEGELIAGRLWSRMGLGAKDRYEIDLLELEALMARGYADGYRDGYVAGVEAAGRIIRAGLDR